jgi:hypothetical protein
MNLFQIKNLLEKDADLIKTLDSNSSFRFDCKLEYEYQGHSILSVDGGWVQVSGLNIYMEYLGKKDLLSRIEIGKERIRNLIRENKERIVEFHLKQMNKDFE